MRNGIIHHKIIIITVLTLLCGLTWLLVRAKPATEADIRRSACYVEGTASLCLVSGRDTVALTADSVSQEGVWVNRHWWWPSCDGRVLTLLGGTQPRLHGIPLPVGQAAIEADSLRRYAAVGADSLGRLLRRKETEGKELQYYLRSHGVIDEGYTQIAAYAQSQAAETKALRRRVASLLAILHADSARRAGSGKTAADGRRKVKDGGLGLVCKLSVRVSWYDSRDSMNTVGCRPVVCAVSGAPRPVIVHTNRSVKPWGVYAVRNVPWGATRHRKVVTVTLPPHPAAGKDSASAILATGSYDRGRGHDLPRLFAADGSPVFTVHGRFIGIIAGKEVVQ